MGLRRRVELAALTERVLLAPPRIAKRDCAWNLEQVFQNEQALQVIGEKPSHAESETVTHQDSRAGKDRNSRGRKATACPAPCCGAGGETYQENFERVGD